MAIIAQAYAVYGVHLTPFETDQDVCDYLHIDSCPINIPQRINFWIYGWRSANSDEAKSHWVTHWMHTAEKALYSSLLSAPEIDALIFDLTSPARLYSQRSGCEIASAEYSTPQTLPCPSLSPPASLHSSFGEAVQLATPQTLPSSPALLSQPQPKKRGRKRGSRDREKRARRGTLAHLSHAEKSKRGRERAKLHKLQEQQQPQQQEQ